MGPQRGGCSAQLHVLPAPSVFREEEPGPRLSQWGKTKRPSPRAKPPRDAPVGAEQAAHTGLLCCSHQPQKLHFISQ